MQRLYFAALCSIVALVACVQIAGIEEAFPTWTGTGAATTSTTTATATTATATTSSSSSSSGTSSGGTGAPCQSDVNCDAEHVCSAIGVCLLKNGQPCNTVTACDSSFCVDGVCCNSACNTTCHACSAALTGGAAGTCAPATDGTIDPRAMCAKTAQPTCGTNGTCLQGACNFWPLSTICGTVSNSCQSVGGDFFVSTKICDGKGSCSPAGTVMCSSAWGCGMDQSSCACGKASDCPNGFPTCNTQSECAL